MQCPWPTGCQGREEVPDRAGVAPHPWCHTRWQTASSQWTRQRLYLSRIPREATPIPNRRCRQCTMHAALGVASGESALFAHLFGDGVPCYTGKLTIYWCIYCCIPEDSWWFEVDALANTSRPFLLTYPEIFNIASYYDILKCMHS